MIETHHHKQGESASRLNGTYRQRRHTAKRKKQHKRPAATLAGRERKCCSFILPCRQAYCSTYMAAARMAGNPKSTVKKVDTQRTKFHFPLFPIYEIYITRSSLEKTPKAHVTAQLVTHTVHRVSKAQPNKSTNAQDTTIPPPPP